MGWEFDHPEPVSPMQDSVLPPFIRQRGEWCTREREREYERERERESPRVVRCSGRHGPS